MPHLVPARQARATRMIRWLISLTLVAAIGLQASRAEAVAEVAPPQIAALNAVVLSDVNQVLFDRNAHQRTAPASTTKMMTAIVAARHGNLDMQVTIDESDIVGESTMGLVSGEIVTLRALLYGMLLPSGNDAAHAIARSIGYRDGDATAAQSVQRFVDMMNQTAREFQLRNTHFMNPHGLDENGHYSTPFDLAIILRAALNHEIIRQVMQTRSFNADGHDLFNGNRLFGMREDIIGGKTGFTDAAGFCLAAAAWKDGRYVIAVVTQDDGDNWVWDVSNLLDYGLQAQRERPLPRYVNATVIGTQFKQTDGALKQGSP